jgi:hypothetical protein
MVLPLAFLFIGLRYRQQNSLFLSLVNRKIGILDLLMSIEFVKD